MKQTRVYVCSDCGTEHPRWQGKCDQCGAWNALKQFQAPTPPAKRVKEGANIQELSHFHDAPQRILSGVEEFDRVCGGGVVPGSVLLLAGEPGVGKSTLMMRLLANYQNSKENTSLYICGEESPHQVQQRATRLKVKPSSLHLTADKELLAIAKSLKTANFSILAIDSIQTVWRQDVDAAPGSVMQVRAVTQFLSELARQRDIVLFLIGHVTKEGVIAGPKLTEHMVDVVLSLESEAGHDFRLLRAKKNRFGSTSEIGVFAMTQQGLEEVKNPSALFLDEEREEAPGSAIYAGMAGSRPILLDIQALVAPSPLSQPRRACVGFDHHRLAMILAVLERYGSLQFSGKDVYLNVTGGYRLDDPAADCAVAAALVSAWYEHTLNKATIFFGEIGLGGEIRPVSHTDTRINEAIKLGFLSACAPIPKNTAHSKGKIRVENTRRVKDLIQMIKVSA